MRGKSVHLQRALAHHLKHVLYRVGLGVFDIKRAQSAAFCELELEFYEHDLGKQNNNGRKDRALDKARAAGETHDGRGPEPGGGRKPWKSSFLNGPYRQMSPVTSPPKRSKMSST